MKKRNKYILAGKTFIALATTMGIVTQMVVPTVIYANEGPEVKIARSEIQMATAKSEMQSENIEMSLDGNPSTYTDSNYNDPTGEGALPQIYTFKLYETKNLSKIRILPRSSSTNGRVNKYEISINGNFVTGGSVDPSSVSWVEIPFSPTEGNTVELKLWSDFLANVVTTAEVEMYYVEKEASITELHIADEEDLFAYVRQGESKKLNILDQNGNSVDPSLLTFSLDNSDGYITVDSQGTILGVNKSTKTNAITRVKVSLKENPEITTTLKVVVPLDPVIEDLEVSTTFAGSYKPIENALNGAISDNASKIYYFKVKGSAEWRSDLDKNQSYTTNGIPTVRIYLDGTLAKESKFSWQNPRNISQGITNLTNEMNVSIPTYGEHTIRVEIVGLDGKSTDKVYTLNHTPVWLNSDGSIKRISANAGDVEIPEVVNGITMISLDRQGSDGILEGVTSLTLPDSIESIDDNFFEKAVDLKKLVFTGNVPSGNLDLSKTSITEIVVPAEKMDEYKNAMKDWLLPNGVSEDSLLKPDRDIIAPIIEAEDRTITQGDSFDPLEGVSAKDGDVDLTNLVEYSGVYDVNTPGTYEILYSVKDEAGNQGYKKIVLTVLPKQISLNHVPVIQAKDLVITVGSSFDLLKGVTATDKEDGDLTDKIQVKSTVDSKKAGEYTVTYTVSDSQGATATKIIRVTVKPKEESKTDNKTDTKKDKKVNTSAVMSAGLFAGMAGVSALGMSILNVLRKKKDLK